MDASELTASSALKQWQRARQFHANSLKFGVGTSHRYISVLIVSNDCVRALLVEKTIHKLLPAFFARQAASDDACGDEQQVELVSQSAPNKSDRLLLLSAGLNNEPGAPVPTSLLAAAAEYGVDLTDDNPRAAFDPSDLVDPNHSIINPDPDPEPRNLNPEPETFT
jgi:hypothetical protein